MKDTQLIQVLKTLDKKQFREFEKLVASPFYSTGRNLVPLLGELKKFHPGFESKSCTKEMLYQKLYSKKYDDNADRLMRILITDMLKLTKEYLFILTMREYPADKNLFTAYKCESLKLSKLAMEFYNKADEEIEAAKIDEHYFDLKYQLHISMVSHFLNKNEPRKVFEHIKLCGDYSFYYFLSELASNYHNIDANRYSYNQEFKNSIVEEIINAMDFKKIEKVILNYGGDLKEVILPYLYYIISLSDSEDEIYYEKMKEIFFKNSAKYGLSKRYALFVYLMNLSIKGRRAKNNKYKNEQFEIYKKMVENNVLLDSNSKEIRTDFFQSILTSAVSANEPGWAEGFLNEYIGFVEKSQKDNLYNFSMALICFERKKYDESLGFMSKVQLDLFVYKFWNKILLLKIHYEENNIEQILSLIDTFKHFIIENTTVSDSNRLNSQNFLQVYTELVNIKLGKDEPDMNKIKDKILNTPSLPERRWLYSKTEEI